MSENNTEAPPVEAVPPAAPPVSGRSGPRGRGPALPGDYYLPGGLYVPPGLYLPDHVSFSQFSKFSFCAIQYFRYYVLGEPAPGTIDLALGSSYHKALEFDYLQKIRTGANEPFSAKEDVFVLALRDEFAKGLALREGETLVDAEALGRKLLRLHHDKIALKTIPLEVERRVEIRVPGMPVPIVGFLDLRELVDEKTGRQKVTDHKTSGKKYDPDSARLSFQLALYSEDTGVEDVGFDVLIKSRVPEVQRVEGKITPQFRAYCLSTLKTTYDQMRSGLFVPATPGKWPCGPSWCHYWSECAGKHCSAAGLTTSPKE